MQVNEETSFELSVKTFNEDRESVTPTTARYKIHDLTNNRSIRSFTDITAASEMSIVVTPDDNVILSDGNRTERRQLQLQTDYDTDQQNVFVYEWNVLNLA